MRVKSLSRLLPKELVRDKELSYYDVYDTYQHFLYEINKDLKDGNVSDSKYRERIKTFLQDSTKPVIMRTLLEVKNKVANSLIKRGMIVDTIYDNYKYIVDGEIIDATEYSIGTKECWLVPAEKSTYFYECFLNISVDVDTSNETIDTSIYNLLGFLSVLEDIGIRVKITLVLMSSNTFNRTDRDRIRDYTLLIPYKDPNTLIKHTKASISSSMFRGAMFHLIHKAQKAVNSFNSTLGNPHNPTNLLNVKENYSLEDLIDRVLQDKNLKEALDAITEKQ